MFVKPTNVAIEELLFAKHLKYTREYFPTGHTSYWIYELNVRVYHDYKCYAVGNDPVEQSYIRCERCKTIEKLEEYLIEMRERDDECNVNNIHDKNNINNVTNMFS